jgi:phage terminase small subunit
MHGLTPRQAEFVRHFLVSLNATKAAELAGYSAKTANEQGSRLLAKASVKAAVNAAQAKRAARLELKGEDVLRALQELAFFDPAAFYGADGELKNIHAIPLESRRALAGLEVEELFGGYGSNRTRIGDTVKVKWSDRLRALELLGKHLRLFTDRVEHSGPGGAPLSISINLGGTDE